ncbi:MAG: peptidoglycan-binding protein [Oculatellaceae cyanobacterium Prado106]|jgi:peptidoglycan hydrolase-like protein with peptidoglycan-binding domain|nr:peptidoglycan-binding protein [Oculatellaceae cyanobacterium Prado106]
MDYHSIEQGTEVHLHSVQVDGVFGEVTEGLVKNFQLIFFLSQDGIVGSRTWNSLLTRKPPADLPVLRVGSQAIATPHSLPQGRDRS